jgi:hypothetical protein
VCGELLDRHALDLARLPLENRLELRVDAQLDQLDRPLGQPLAQKARVSGRPRAGAEHLDVVPEGAMDTDGNLTSEALFDTGSRESAETDVHFPCRSNCSAVRRFHSEAPNHPKFNPPRAKRLKFG